MMYYEKKTVLVSGSVLFPLEIGGSAIIVNGTEVIRTSAVAAIQHVSRDLIVFETRNSKYCVASTPSPAPEARTINIALCAA